MSQKAPHQTLSGHCSCGTISYRLVASPMVVHCCHCTWCQVQSGSAFAVNALVEMSKLEVTSAAPDFSTQAIDTPSPSGKGQKIVRCPRCYVALWSHYSSFKELVAFIRVGTLKNASEVRPDVHIFTSTKMPWVDLSREKVPVCEEYYVTEDVWTKEALERRVVLKEAMRKKKEADQAKQIDAKEPGS